MLRIRRFPKTLPVFATLFIIMTTAAAASHAKPARLVILPMNIISQNDMNFLSSGITNMLTSRFTHDGEVRVIGREETQKALQSLDGPIEDTDALKAGRLLDADYVFFGDLTHYGEGMSIDTKMLDLKADKPPLFFFDQCQKLDDVIPRISRIAGKVNKKVFNRITYTEEPTEEETQKRVEQYAHPDKLMGLTPEPLGEQKENVPYWKFWKRIDIPELF